MGLEQFNSWYARSDRTMKSKTATTGGFNAPVLPHFHWLGPAEQERAGQMHLHDAEDVPLENSRRAGS